MSRRKKPTESIELLMELIDIAFVHILHDRKLYPSSIFDEVPHYGVPRKAPDSEILENYLEKLLTALRPMIEQRAVHYFAVIVRDSGEQLIEKFVFKVHLDIKAPTRYLGTVDEIQAQVRNLILKLANICGTLPKLPEGFTYTFEIDGNILLYDLAQIEEEVTLNDAEVDPITVTPVTNISIPPWTVELYIEEFIER